MVETGAGDARIGVHPAPGGADEGDQIMTAGHLFGKDHTARNSSLFFSVNIGDNYVTIYDKPSEHPLRSIHFDSVADAKAFAADILQICEEAQQEFDAANWETQAGDEWDALIAAADEYWQIMAEEDEQRLIEATIEANLQAEADYHRERHYIDM